MKGDRFGSHCAHYDGLAYVRGDADTTCAAGVRYRSVRFPPIRVDGQLPTVLPCQHSARALGAAADTCPARRWPTPEEEAAEEAELHRVCAAVLSGHCATCGGQLQRHARVGGGYVDRCPACAQVALTGCARKR